MLMPAETIYLILLPIGLGLLGFVEPCSIGANLLFLKFLEQRSHAAKLTATMIFALTRAIVIGLLGIVAALIGGTFVGFQKAFWFGLGSIYLVIGTAYLMRKTSFFGHRLGLPLSQIPGTQSPIGLGIAFGLNIPACAAPLLFVLFGTAAGAGTLARGFASMALFGIALSIPLLIIVAFTPAARLFDRLTGLSARLPVATGVVFVLLGLWSMWFGLFVDPADWSGQ